MAIDLKDIKTIRRLTRTAVVLGPSVAAAMTAMLWLADLTGLNLGGNPVLIGGILSCLVLWMLVLIAAHHRSLSSAMREAMHSVNELHLDPATAVPQPRPTGITYLPGALILGMAACAALGTWMQPDAMYWTKQWVRLEPVQLAMTAATAVIWLAAVGAAIHARSLRKTAATFSAFMAKEESARDAVEVIPVLISVCRPDGRRTQFNRMFLDFTGKPEEELRGHGWLACVHAEDRERLMQLPQTSQPIELEYGMFGADGRNRWVRETFVPRADKSGKVERFIATGIDVTRQIETDSTNQNTIEKLNATVDDARIEHREAIERLVAEHEQAMEALTADRTAEFDRLRERHDSTVEEMRTRHREELAAQVKQHRAELGEMKKALSAATKSNEKLEARLAKITDDQRRVSDESGSLRQQAADAKAELQAALADRKHAEVETRKMQESVGKLQALVEKLECEERELREERERNSKLIDGAKAEADEVHRSQTELRSKVVRLTERVQGLEQELDTVRSDHAEALDQISQYETNAAEAMASRNRELAAELKPQLAAVLEVARRLHDCAVDESQLSAIEGAQASAAAMVRLVESALGSESEALDARPAVERAFDLRDAVRSVATLLQPMAVAQGASIQCSLHEEFPGRVMGDPVGMREAIIHAVRGALSVVADDTLHVSLAPSGRTSSHVAARIEVREESRRYERGALEQLLGLQTEGDSAHAAAPWSLVQARGGRYGLDVPRHGGFTLWMEFNLARHADAAASAAATAPVPVAAAPAGFVAPAPAPTPALTASRPALAASAPPSLAAPSLPAEPTGAPAAPASLSDVIPTGPVDAESTPIAALTPPAAPAAPSAPEAPRPLAPRVPQEDLKCNLGDVVELGCDSARLRCSRVPSAPVTLTIDSEEGPLELEAELVSHEPEGRDQMIVVRFTDAVMPDVRRRILAVAMSHRREAGLGGRPL